MAWSLQEEYTKVTEKKMINKNCQSKTKKEMGWGSQNKKGKHKAYSKAEILRQICQEPVSEDFFPVVFLSFLKFYFETGS